MEPIRISVAMCSYNGENYIREQLESILGQKLPVDEIVVCDDGSSDKTVETAREILAGSHVSWKVIRNPENLGYRKNFEQAVSNCSGAYIFLCDQDDIWVKNKTEVIIRQMEQHPRCLLVYTDAFLMGADRSVWEISLWDTLDIIERRVRFPDPWDLLLSGFCVTGATVCFRRELLQHALPFSETWPHDAWLAVHALLYGELLALDDKLIYYRQHGKNVYGVNTERNLKKYAGKIRKIMAKGRQTQTELHRLPLVRWSEFYRKCKNDMPEALREKLRNAVRIHYALYHLPDYSLIKRIRYILVSWKSGGYTDNYQRGKGIMTGDIWFLLLFGGLKK